MIPGKGFQYTPKKTVEWADEFNQLLNNFSSRNDLISKLIEDGLAVQNGSRHKGKGIYIALDSFSDEQLMILNSPDGQKILNNLISSMLGVPSAATFVTPQDSTVHEPPKENISSVNRINTKKEPTVEPIKKVREGKDQATHRAAEAKKEPVIDDDDNTIDALQELMNDALLTDFS